LEVLSLCSKLTKLFAILFASLFLVGCGGGGGGGSSGNGGGNEVKFNTIAVGFSHSLALSNDGKVYATGDNNYGQLSLGNFNDRDTFIEVTDLSAKNIIAISAGYGHSLALFNDGKVYATGHNDEGQLGLGEYGGRRNAFTEISGLTGKNVTAIFAGGDNSFALSGDGKVYATGRNYSGQLGLGDIIDRNTFEVISGLNGKNVTAIFTGGNHSFALSNDGKIYAAGSNYFGELGLGEYGDRYVFTKVTVLSD
jgi:alpha-tubulin suppressor-like RCC1 family protein